MGDREERHSVIVPASQNPVEDWEWSLSFRFYKSTIQTIIFFHFHPMRRSLALGLLAAMTLAACSSATTPTPTGDVIKLGFVGPLTGDTA